MHNYEEWGLESTNLSSSTYPRLDLSLSRLIGSGGLSNPHKTILTNETPIHS